MPGTPLLLQVRQRRPFVHQTQRIMIHVMAGDATGVSGIESTAFTTQLEVVLDSAHWLTTVMLRDRVDWLQNFALHDRRKLMIGKQTKTDARHSGQTVPWQDLPARSRCDGAVGVLALMRPLTVTPEHR